MMDLPSAETALVILGIILAVLQIVHTVMGIRKDVDDDPGDRER
jgi:hypothetical protein